MLNRLYIVVGVLAILVLAGGFLIPRFIDWGEYRERIEEIAEENLGADVTIDGEIDFTLLPQPEMRFGRAVVGPLERPLLEIGGVVAQFSLMDFLRDQFVITSLEVTDPAIYIDLDENGQFDLPLDLPESFSASNVSIAEADITGGSVILTDARTAEDWTLENFAGQLRISGISGPFGLQGTGLFEGETYSVRVTTSALGESGQMQVSTFVRPDTGVFTLAAEGLVQTGDTPKFDGEATFRAAPESGESADEVRGDFVLAGNIELTSDKLLVSEFAVAPDENQPSTRLSGAAVLNLGADRNFDAVLSGGVVALAPRDATEDESSQPYELVRLLTALPQVPVPPIPGRIGVDIGEFDLRAFSLRNVRVDAVTDGSIWQLEGMTGQLPGATELSLAGRLTDDGDRLGYSGQLRIDSSRLDVLSQMWRETDPANPLFNMPGSLSVNLSLAGGELGLSDGTLTLDDESHEFASLLTLEGSLGALLSARLGELSPRQSRAIIALLPDFWSDEKFGISFPNGSIDIAADTATVLDIDGEGFAAQFDWGPGGLHIESMSARNWGGARFNLTGDIRGSLSAPVISGGGSLYLPFGQDRFAVEMLDRLGLEVDVADWFLRSLPVDVIVDVTPANERGEQVLSINGRAGVADVTATASLAGGLARAFTTPMVFEASFGADDGEAFADQLGLGLNPLPSDERAILNVQIGGTATNSFQSTLSAQSGDERLGFAGTLIVSDLMQLRGSGQLDFALSDPGAALALFGVDALALPGISGVSSVNFTSNSTVALTDLDLRVADGPGVAGTLSLSTANDVPLVTGQLGVDQIDVTGLWSALAGRAALLPGEDVWPEGPVDLSPGNRESRGRIEISSPWLRAGDRAVLNDVSMVVNWTDTETGLQNLVGQSLGGTVEGSLNFCCAGLVADKQVSGRMSIEDVPVNALMPDAIGSVLSGTIDGGVSFEGTGASLNELIGSLSGQGSFAVSGLSVGSFDPDAFAALASVEDITDLEPDAISAIVETALENGAFNANELGGIFSIAGGHARADNLATEGEDGRMLGNLDVDLQSLELGGAFTLSPTALADENGLVNPATAQVTANLGGSLLAPERELDVAQMVDAIQARALELEVERLEQLRAEEEARQRAAAEERARLMEIEAQRQAEEAARLAAEQEAQRLRDEEAARQAAEEEARQQQLEPLIFEQESQDPQVTIPDELRLNLDPSPDAPLF